MPLVKKPHKMSGEEHNNFFDRPPVVDHYHPHHHVTTTTTTTTSPQQQQQQLLLLPSNEEDPSFLPEVTQSQETTTRSPHEKPILNGRLVRESSGSLCLDGTWKWSESEDWESSFPFQWISEKQLPPNALWPPVHEPLFCSGWFEAVTSAEGRKRFSEKNVKMEFKSLSATEADLYRIQGCGENELGKFALHGTARVQGSECHIELRKQYFNSAGSTSTAKNTKLPIEEKTSSSVLFSPQRVDTVNGQGMWKAWTRSFDTPLLAVLDLFDNAVDASWLLLPDTIPKIRVDLDTIGRNGVVLQNASKAIPSLREVLQVYKSSKTNDESIGENGIGVKHACASLSSLSFVFTKTIHPNKKGACMSMGILMQDLQKEEGIVLPSMDWYLEEINTLEEELEKICEQQPWTWGRAITEYGESNLRDGIDRCLSHMELLQVHRDWKDFDHVFSVVLTNLKHAAFDDGGDDTSVLEVEGGRKPSSRNSKRKRNEVAHQKVAYHTVRNGGEGDLDEDAQRSLSLLTTLREKLPYLYLHLHDLDISVQGRPIESIYWERRLVELSKFEIQIPQTEWWKAIDKHRYKRSHPRNIYEVTKPDETVRFFCGFDPYRCENKTESDRSRKALVPGDGMLLGNNSALKLYLYSRQSGRLIKVQDDPRNELGLTAGSTDYSQGLTVIIDDYHGTLPLNPTKQDTAYGHSKHGAIHASNVKEWAAAITHFYWQFQYERFQNSRLAVTKAVAAARGTLEAAHHFGQQRTPRHSEVCIPRLCRGNFITYENLEFGKAGTKIRANRTARNAATPRIPSTEVVRLDENAAAQAIVSRSQTPKRTPAKRLRSIYQDEIEIYESRGNGTMHPLQEKLKEYIERNTQLMQINAQQTNTIRGLEATCASLRREQISDREAMKRCQLETANYKELALKASEKLEAQKTPDSGVSQQNDPTARLKREVQLYKSQANFYKKESASRNVQIEHLMAEKSRFEERVQELEACQFAGGGEDLLEF